MKPIFLPGNFDGRKHLDRWHTKVAADPDIDPDVLEYLVHMIMRRYSFSDKSGDKRKGYVPLYSLALKRVSKQYRKHLEYLSATYVIDINNRYSTEEHFTKSYRLKPKYMNAKPIAKELTNRRLLRLHNKINREEIEGMRRVREKYPYLVSALDGLTIDRKAALAYVDDLSTACLLFYGSSEHKKLQWRFNVMRLGIERIAHQDFSYSVDEKGRRFHTNHISLKKELRNFLSYNGEPLGDVDIKNSQPYLGQVLLQPAFWEGRQIDTRSPATKSRQRKRLQEGKDSPESMYKMAEGKLGWNEVLETANTDNTDTSDNTTTTTATQQQHINMLLKNPEIRDSSGFALFHEMVNKGLYEFLKDLIPDMLFYDADMLILYGQMGFPNITRPFVKKLTMRALYGPHQPTRPHSKFARKMLQHCFPEVMKVFAAIKTGKGKSYARLPIMLQRIESILVLDRICKTFSKRYRQPVFTIHDGLVTTLPYLEKLKSVAEDVITRAVGVKPNLVEEHWSPKHLEGQTDDILRSMLEILEAPNESIPPDGFNIAEYYCILVPYGQEYQTKPRKATTIGTNPMAGCR